MKSFILACGLCAVAAAAHAHVTLEQTEAAAGSTAKITLRVPHGCEGQATHTVRVTVPEGFYGVKPMPKAGWQLDTTVGTYAAPYTSHGHTMSEGVTEVVWSRGNLEDAWYDEFIMRGSVGPDVAPGTVLFFPTVQDCDSAKAEWMDTSDDDEAAKAAPRLTVTAATGHDDHAAMVMFKLGDLTIEHPFSRATLPNAPVAGGFMTVTNTGTTDDRLIGASSDVAGRMEVHEMAMQGDVMKMRQLVDGLPIPAGQTVMLKPGGFHIMFMDLKKPLVEGGAVNVTLTFEKAGSIEIPLEIGAPNQGAMKHGGHAMPAMNP